MSGLTVEDLEKMKVVELRQELTKRGLVAAGVKAELVKRLAAAVAQEENVEEEIDIVNDPVGDGMRGDEGSKKEAEANSKREREIERERLAEEEEVERKREAEELRKKEARSNRFPQQQPNANEEEERKKEARANRFPQQQQPTSNDEERKKEARANRFPRPASSPVAPSAADLLSDEAKLRRAERLGGVKRSREGAEEGEEPVAAAAAVKIGPTSADLLAPERQALRAQRFGIPPATADPSVGATELVAPQVLEKRAQRFQGNRVQTATELVSEDRLSARQARFPEGNEKKKKARGVKEGRPAAAAAAPAPAAFTDPVEAEKAAARKARFNPTAV